MIRAGAFLGLALALASCRGQAPPPQNTPPAEPKPATAAPEEANTPSRTPTAECAAWQPEAPYATPLRDTLTAPDPRVATTLVNKGFSVDRAGIERALASTDPTTHLAALTAVAALRCGSLLGEVERHLGSPAPVALEAAVTLVEVGEAAQVTRGKAALRDALADDSWPEVQLNAAKYLAHAGDPTGLPVLRRALSSNQEALRLQAVLAVPAFAGVDGLDPVAVYETVLLGPDPSALVRREAVYRLAALPRSPRRDALLAKVAEDDPDPRVRRAASLRR